MKPFQALDYYEIDTLLTEEERLIRNTLRDFVSEQVMPRIEKHFREGTFPRELVPQLSELGTLGSGLQGYGCTGLGPVAYGLIMQELERGDSGLRSFVSVQGGLVMYPIHTFGSEEQKERWLPAMARGEIIGCFGLTEPDFGSDPAGMLTRAVQRADRYVLNGTKAWITNGTIADLAVIWAKMEGEIHGFLVEKGTPGFSARDHQGKFSLRASVTSELALQDCAIPLQNRLPGAQGLKAALACLNQARYGIAWGVVGSAMAVFDEALEYARTRIVFGKPLSVNQAVQWPLSSNRYSPST